MAIDLDVEIERTTTKGKAVELLIEDSEHWIPLHQRLSEAAERHWDAAHAIANHAMQNNEIQYRDAYMDHRQTHKILNQICSLLTGDES